MVNRDLEATIRLRIRGAGSREQDIEAVIDTGFNGFLTLSPVLVRRLDLTRIGQSRVLLASGKEDLLDLYEVAILWDGQWRTVELDAAEAEALVGMGLLYRYSVQIHAIEGGQVIIEALP